LREHFGPRWFESPKAGELLRGLWAEGQRLSADDLLQELDGSRLELSMLATELRETLD
jgi:hypothetical protein